MEDTKIVSKKSKTTCACGNGCNCGCGGPVRLLKWLVGIILLGIVFLLGVKAGEFRIEFRDLMAGSYHYQMMMNQQGGGGFVPPITVYPATNTSTAQ
jgi:hypothetical protein